MAVQIYSNPVNPSANITIAQTYDILKQLEGTFFGTVTLTEQDGNVPAHVMCTHKDTGVDLLDLRAYTSSPSSSGGLMGMNIIGHFYDGENATQGSIAPGQSGWIYRIGICNNAIAFTENTGANPVIIAFDAYGDYTFLYGRTGSSYTINNPISYSYEAYTSAMQYGYVLNSNDGQIALAPMPVPIMASGHPYNYIKDVYACIVRDQPLGGLNHVMIGDDHYISAASAYFLKD